MLNLSKNKQSNQVEVTISNRTIIRILLLIVFTFILISLLRRSTHALLMISIAFFLSIALNEPVYWLGRHLPGKHNSRVLATSVSFAIVVALLVGFTASIVPPILRQTRNFIDVAPSLVEDVRNQDSSLGQFVRKYHLQSQVEDLSAEIASRTKNINGPLVDTVQRVSSSAISILTVLVLTFMMLVESKRWLHTFKRLVPIEKRDHVEKMTNDMYRVVRGYVNGQILLATLASIAIFIPLLILGVSYPIALMVIVFVCGLIPLVGHTLGAIIVTIVALFHSPIAAIIILAYYTTYQQLENYILQPKIQSNSTNMSPLLVFGAVLVGVSLNGLLGGLLAIPLAGCIRIVIIDYLDSRNLLTKNEEESITIPN